MKIYILKWLMLSVLAIFVTNIDAKEAKGYKIILVSCQEFNEAKNQMNLLGGKLSKEDWDIQKKYGYTIVARPSGKVFIVAIEPLATKEAVSSVRKQFKKFYPDSYSNGYFGPTEGSVVLSPPLEKTTKESVLIQKNPILTPPVGKPLEKWEWIITVLGLIAIAIFLTRIRKSAQATTTAFQKTKDEKSQATPKEAQTEIKKIDSGNIAQEDIFYALKKNRFFKMLVDELKGASDRREEQQCYDIIQEMHRYEKKFQTSRILIEMEELINSKKFRQLSEFIALQKKEL